MISDFWISFIIASFATYRISRMLALEEGPFEIFLDARTFLWEKAKGKAWVEKGISCPLCISFYVGAVVALLLVLQLHYEWYAFFWLWFALSGTASFLYEIEQ